MSQVNDNDLELLEMYLDDELGPDEVENICRRLSDERDFAKAMTTLRAQRSARQEAFSAIERELVDSAQCARLVGQALHGAAARELVWAGRRRVLRQFSAAACVAVGLLVGWLVRGATEEPPRHFPPLATREIIESDYPTYGTKLVSNTREPRSTGFNVVITDDVGRVLAEQHFDSLEQAREFTTDLSRWQNRQRQLRNGDIRLVGDDF